MAVEFARTPEEGPGQRGSLGTVRNAAVLLRLMSEGPAHQQLTELAERSGMSLATVHRLLRSLVLAGLAEQHPESSRYGLGPEVVRLSESYLSRLPVVRGLSPYLVRLREETGLRIQVALLVGHEVVYADRVDAADPGPFRTPHQVHRALDTAAGRILLSRAPDREWARGVAAVGGAVGPEDRARWAREPFQVLVPDEVHADAEGAVPVVDDRGHLLGALVASGSSRRDDPAALARDVAPLLQRAAGSATVGRG